jgi:hypothetical protein
MPDEFTQVVDKVTGLKNALVSTQGPVRLCAPKQAGYYLGLLLDRYHAIDAELARLRSEEAHECRWFDTTNDRWKCMECGEPLKEVFDVWVGTTDSESDSSARRVQ